MPQKIDIPDSSMHAEQTGGARMRERKSSPSEGNAILDRRKFLTSTGTGLLAATLPGASALAGISPGAIHEKTLESGNVV